MLYCLLLLAVVLCRNKWAGAGVIAVTMALVTTGPFRLVIVVTALAIHGASALLALRYGLLEVFAAAWAFSTLINFPLTLDPSSFYFAASLAALASVIGAGVYAFRYAAHGERLRT